MKLSKEEESKIAMSRKMEENEIACQKEIEKVLKKYGMDLRIVGEPRIVIVAKQK